MSTRLTAAVALASLVVAGAAYGAASKVLIQEPEAQRHVGDLMSFGVWYQSYSGGARNYTISVYNPSGRRVLLLTGKAPAKWKIFHYAPQDVGVYKTVFALPSGRTTSRTRVLGGD